MKYSWETQKEKRYFPESCSRGNQPQTPTSASFRILSRFSRLLCEIRSNLLVRRSITSWAPKVQMRMKWRASRLQEVAQSGEISGLSQDGDFSSTLFQPSDPEEAAVIELTKGATPFCITEISRELYGTSRMREKIFFNKNAANWQTLQPAAYARKVLTH